MNPVKLHISYASVGLDGNINISSRQTVGAVHVGVAGAINIVSLGGVSEIYLRNMSLPTEN